MLYGLYGNQEFYKLHSLDLDVQGEDAQRLELGQDVSFKFTIIINKQKIFVYFSPLFEILKI
jgi:hypothetical protein